MNTQHRRWRMSIVAALAAAALTMACQLLRPPDALKRKSDLIAYVGTDYNIYTVDRDGGQLTAVTTDADVEGDTLRVYDLPAWAPDSQSLVFAGYRAPKDLDVTKFG